MGNWRDTLITRDKTILETMQLIDKSSMQIAVVVDSSEHILGTVTDGDIRRGILKGMSLDFTVDNVMNTQPFTAPYGKSVQEYEMILQRKDLKQLPLVDELGKVLDLYTIKSKAAHRRYDNFVVLMVGGLGTRLRPLTDEIPKPMLHVGGKPILETIIESFKDAGFYRFILSVSYKKEQIENYFQDGSNFDVEISYLHEDKRLGTAGPLSLIKEPLDKPVIVMNGDLLTKVNFEQLVDFHIENKAEATMCVRDYEFQVPYGVIKTHQHKLVAIEEKPIHHSYVNAGIYVLNPSVIDLVPYNEFYDMPDLFSTLILKESNVHVFPLREYWMDIGQIKDFEQADKDFKNIFE